MTKLKTSGIVAISMAVGIIGGAAVTAFAAQPNMEAALGNLINAEAYLQKAAENKAGHRLKAIALVQQAIREVRAGIQAGK